MKDAFERFLEELYSENKDKLELDKKQGMVKVVKSEIDRMVSDDLSKLFLKELKADLNVLEIEPKKKLIFEGYLYKDEFDFMPLKVSVELDKFYNIVKYEVMNIEEIKRRLNVEKYAVWIKGSGVEIVEAVDEKVAVKKVLSSIFEKNRRILLDNRIYLKKDINELVDVLLSKGCVMKFSEYIKKFEESKMDKESIEEPIVYDYDYELRQYQSSFSKEETDDIIERLFGPEIDLQKQVYSVLQLKRQIASIIEDDLSKYGIDAVVEIRKFEDSDLGDKNICKGVIDVYSSFVNASVPFVAVVNKEGYVKEVSYRDKEIKKMANLKIFGLNINGNELEILATGVPVVLETAKRVLGRNVSIDELIEKYQLREKGEYGRLIDDAKDVNPWRVISTEKGDYLIRIKKEKK